MCIIKDIQNSFDMTSLSLNASPSRAKRHLNSVHAEHVGREPPAARGCPNGAAKSMLRMNLIALIWRVALRPADWVVDRLSMHLLAAT